MALKNLFFYGAQFFFSMLQMPTRHPQYVLQMPTKHPQYVLQMPKKHPQEATALF